MWLKEYLMYVSDSSEGPDSFTFDALNFTCLFLHEGTLILFFFTFLSVCHETGMSACCVSVIQTEPRHCERGA